MDNLVQSLKTLTEHMVDQLDYVTEEQIVFFIDQRGQIVDQLRQLGVSAADRERYGSVVTKVLEADPIITAKLEQLRDEAADNMQRVSVAKVQNTAYNNPYETDNSYYFDQKN